MLCCVYVYRYIYIHIFRERERLLAQAPHTIPTSSCGSRRGCRGRRIAPCFDSWHCHQVWTWGCCPTNMSVIFQHSCGVTVFPNLWKSISIIYIYNLWKSIYIYITYGSQYIYITITITYGSQYIYI